MSEHKFSKAIDHPVFTVVQQAADALKQETFVIGGFVRDYFLNQNHQFKDIDIVTVGSGIKLAKKTAALLPNASAVKVFKNFGTAMLKTGNIELEFVGARRESYQRGSRKPVVENGSLADDQHRRDFTINAMAFALNKANYGLLVDPFHGISDLHNQIIRTPLEPERTYSDDPLRMLRAIRFACRLGFTIEKKSLEAIKSQRHRLKIISKERIVEETHKILLCKKPSAGFELLNQTALLPLILPELTNLKGVEEVEGQSHKDNFWHTLEVVDNIAVKTENLWLRWAALLHDIGKAPTKKFDAKTGWTFHSHEFVGSKMVYKLFKRLRLPLNNKMKYVQKLVLLSSRPIALSLDAATDSAVRRLIFDAGTDINDLMTLCEADITTKNYQKKKKYLANFEKVRRKIAEVEERDRIRNFQPPVKGEEIMKIFNLPPSREVGNLKEAIKEAILEGEIANNTLEAYRFLLKKGEEMGLTVVNKLNIEEGR